VRQRVCSGFTREYVVTNTPVGDRDGQRPRSV